MPRDALREEEYWHEVQSGQHAPDFEQRVPSGGYNERACKVCGFAMFTHRGGVCPNYERDADGWPMARKDDAA